MPGKYLPLTTCQEIVEQSTIALFPRYKEEANQWRTHFVWSGMRNEILIYCSLIHAPNQLLCLLLYYEYLISTHIHTTSQCSVCIWIKITLHFTLSRPHVCNIKLQNNWCINKTMVFMDISNQNWYFHSWYIYIILCVSQIHRYSDICTANR